MRAIQAQNVEIKDLSRQIADLRSMVEASSLTKNIEAKSLAERYQLEIPLKTEEDFTDLETLLENDRSFSKEFVSYININIFYNHHKYF